ncbi:unnamed protein product [Nesidiocoris tenuis]|uniref:Uncharacterized protein n=1 Tax=Nesidiocoris tenuis TaxID=355587 RepID=A0A6H5HE02_9HEMI|nr:unnamed protein product [Nesidiocoris tenuis]
MVRFHVPESERMLSIRQDRVEELMSQLRQEDGSDSGVYHIVLPDGRLQRVEFTTAPVSAVATSANLESSLATAESAAATLESAAAPSAKLSGPAAISAQIGRTSVEASSKLTAPAPKEQSVSGPAALLSQSPSKVQTTEASNLVPVNRLFLIAQPATADQKEEQALEEASVVQPSKQAAKYLTLSDFKSYPGKTVVDFGEGSATPDSQLTIRRVLGIRRDEYYLNGHQLTCAQLTNVLEVMSFSLPSPYFVNRSLTPSESKKISRSEQCRSFVCRLFYQIVDSNYTGNAVLEEMRKLDLPGEITFIPLNRIQPPPQPQIQSVEKIKSELSELKEQLNTAIPTSAYLNTSVAHLKMDDYSKKIAEKKKLVDGLTTEFGLQILHEPNWVSSLTLGQGSRLNWITKDEAVEIVRTLNETSSRPSCSFLSSSPQSELATPTRASPSASSASFSSY